jgi:hypothetical protein
MIHCRFSVTLKIQKVKLELKNLIPVILAAFPLMDAMGQKSNLITNWKYSISAPSGRSTGSGNPLPFPDATHANSIVVGVGYGVVRLDPAGKELFNFQTAGDVMIPAIGDLEKDGKTEIVIPTTSGTIYCIDEAGKLLWKNELKDNLYDFGGAVLADIDGDGKLESFFNAKAGTIYCLNSDGTLRWKVLTEPRACNPAVGDVDGDGKCEIFYGTDLGKIFCLDYNGRYLWNTEIPNGVYGRSSPTLADLDGDGRYELIMPHSNTTPYPAIVVLDANSGKLLWKGNTVMQNYGGTSVADLGHDGKLEVIVVDKGNTVNVFNWDGRLKWQTTLSGRGMFFAAGVADFFNDGNLEILCGCRNTGPEGQTMFLLDERGKVLREYKEGGDRQNSPVIADLNGDKIPEIIFADVAQKSIVSYTLDGTKSGGAIPWPCWKQSPTNAGFIRSHSVNKVPMDFKKPGSLVASKSTPSLIGRNKLIVSLPATYKGSDIFCESRMTDGRGIINSSFTWSENKDNKAEVPYSLSAEEEQKLEYILRDRSSHEVLRHELLTVSAAEYLMDRNKIISAGSEMKEIAGKLPSSDLSMASGLLSGISQAETLLSDATALRQPQMKEAAGKAIENNRQKIDFSLKFGRFLNQIRQSGNKGSFYVWQNPNPWNDVSPENIFPVHPTPDTTFVSVLAMGNETEDFALELTNLTESSQVVKVYSYNLVDGKGKSTSFGDVAELREAINTPDGRGNMVDEVIPKLNEGKTLHLGVFDSRKLWVKINTKSLEPGHYRFRLGFESVSPVEYRQNIVVNLEVSTVRLLEKNEFAFNTWSSIEIADDWMREMVVKDLLDHKIGVLSMLPGPRFYLDSEGKLAADWSHWDKYYTPLKDKIVCFVTSALSVETNGHQVSKEAYASLLKDAYALAHKGMEERGINRDQWAIYVMDEPALTGYPSIEIAVNIAKEIRAASPDMQLYIDPAGMVTPETMKAFEGLIDIYSPQIDLLKDPDGRLLYYFHGLNKRLWFYEAPSPARTFHPLGHYRTQAWLAFDYGLTGCGFWCYNSNNANNLWRVTAPDDYDAIYNDGSNIIPSRRWEASRDGVEDYHLLMMLKRKIAAFKEGSEQEKSIAREAEEQMTYIVRNITARMKKVKEISRDFIPYELDYSLFEDARKTLIGTLEKMNQLSNSNEKK